MTTAARVRLVTRLHDEGLAPKAIAKVSGLSSGEVFHLLKACGLSKKAMSRPIQLTSWEEAILLGSLLGDGRLVWKRRPNGTVYFTMGHSAKQAEYMQWKIDQLGDLFFHDTVRVYEGNHHNPGARAISRSCSFLIPFHALFYGSATTKQINDDILNRVASHDFRDVILAVWFGDDGYRSSGNGRSLGLVLGVDCVSMFERVAEWFSSMGFEGQLHQHRKHETYRYLLFRVESAHRLRETVAPYLPTFMHYKLDIGSPRKIRRPRGSKEG